MLLDLFLIGLVVNVEPIPVTAMILLLAADRGVIKGVGFVLGWMLTLVVIVAATVLITDGRPRPRRAHPRRPCWPPSWPAGPCWSSSPTGAGTACAAKSSGAGGTAAAQARAAQAAEVDGQHRPGESAGRRRPGLHRPALGPGGGRGLHHRRGQAEQRPRVLRRLRLLPLVHGQLPDHGDLRRGAPWPSRPGCGPCSSGSTSTGTRPSPSCRWCSAST